MVLVVPLKDVLVFQEAEQHDRLVEEGVNLLLREALEALLQHVVNEERYKLGGLGVEANELFETLQINREKRNFGVWELSMKSKGKISNIIDGGLEVLVLVECLVKERIKLGLEFNHLLHPDGGIGAGSCL